MRSIDTNVVLRLILQDEPRQTVLVEQMVEGGVLVPLTVLLETAWVLTSRYGFPRSVAADLLSRMVDLPTVSVEAGDHVAWALRRFAAGADPADMIHLVGSRHATSFATFDRRVARQAGSAPPTPIETLRF